LFILLAVPWQANDILRDFTQNICGADVFKNGSKIPKFGVLDPLHLPKKPSHLQELLDGDVSKLVGKIQRAAKTTLP
jgi:hypothetical protein